MAKRNRSTTAVKIEKWIKEGRGTGEGADYKPWLTIRDVPSRGIATRNKGWKTKRIHQLMSKLELNYLYTLEWSDAVIDIREQYPLLPLERTLEIADDFGIKHPTDPQTNEETVMTTDFLITIATSNGLALRARTIKPSSDLNKRTIEKFAIEQQFYKEQDIDWGIVTEKDKSEQFIRNIDFLYNARYIENIPGVTEERLKSISSWLLLEITNSSDPLSVVALNCDERLGYKLGTCLFIVKYMIANKNWLINIYEEIDPLKKIDIKPQ
nr:heteromeric transposase endonuclease subunit TnsA [Priestia megaterium]